MKVHIATVEEEGWVLRRIAHSFADFFPQCSISTKADPLADINFYVNYPLFSGKTKGDVGFFTHREKDPSYSAVFDAVAQEVDWCVAMSQKTAALLPPGKTSIIVVPVDSQFVRTEIVIGVVGREYPTNRKRFYLLEELKSIKGLKFKITNGEMPFSELPAFYQSIDYLLVLSDVEGGPLPVREAMAMGKPVIAPDVGFAWEHPVIRYGSVDDLIRTLRMLAPTEYGWEQASAELRKIFDKVHREK